MERISLKAYAVKHKLSIFNVMKMVKSGDVKSEVFQENGREVTYILYDEESENEIKSKIVPLESAIEEEETDEVVKTLKILTKEIEMLRKEIENLKREMR